MRWIRNRQLNAKEAQELTAAQYPAVGLKEVLDHIKRSAQEGRGRTVFYYHKNRMWPEELTVDLLRLRFDVTLGHAGRLRPTDKEGVLICWE